MKLSVPPNTNDDDLGGGEDDDVDGGEDKEKEEDKDEKGDINDIDGEE